MKTLILVLGAFVVFAGIAAQTQQQVSSVKNVILKNKEH